MHRLKTASPNDVDSTPGNDVGQTPDEDDEDDVTIVPMIGEEFADLELTKTADRTTYSRWEHVIFTIEVTNNGPDDATNVTVKDAIPSGLAFTSADPSQGTYSNFLGIWTVGTIPAGTNRDFSVGSVHFRRSSSHY